MCAKRRKKVQKRKREVKGLISALVLAVLWMAVFSGCAKKTEPVVSENGLFKLRVVTQTTAASETAIADRMGFFRDEGIEIVYVGTLGQGITQFQAIAQGDIDVYTQGHFTPLAQARLAGLKIVAVAPGMVDDPDNGHVTYLVREDSRLKTLDDLPGAKVGIGSQALCVSGYLQIYLEDRGLDFSKVELITMAQPGQPEQAVLQGLIDVTTSHSPHGGLALAAGGVRVIGKSWDIFQSPAAGLAIRGFSEEFVEKHPDIVQGWVNAMYRARVFNKTNPDQARLALADYFDFAPEDISANVFDQNKNFDPEWVQLWFDMSERLGYWNKGDVLPEDCYTNKFVPRDVPASDLDLKL
jgi:ABC-type nitrate/sulfonate/bicarbonate transport system substrate-binding protein